VADELLGLPENDMLNIPRYFMIIFSVCCIVPILVYAQPKLQHAKNDTKFSVSDVPYSSCLFELRN
jgi:hypothetical protein